jgi:hypothetical protein
LIFWQKIKSNNYHDFHSTNHILLAINKILLTTPDILTNLFDKIGNNGLTQAAPGNEAKRRRGEGVKRRRGEDAKMRRCEEVKEGEDGC